MCHGKKAKATTHWRYIGVNRRYKGGYAPWRLQCHGGKKLNCNRKNGPWSNYRVVCTTRRVKVTVHKKVVHHKKVVKKAAKKAHKKPVHKKVVKKVAKKAHKKPVHKRLLKKIKK